VARNDILEENSTNTEEASCSGELLGGNPDINQQTVLVDNENIVNICKETTHKAKIGHHVPSSESPEMDWECLRKNLALFDENDVSKENVSGSGRKSKTSQRYDIVKKVKYKERMKM